MPPTDIVVAVPTYRRPTSLDLTIHLVLREMDDVAASSSAPLVMRLVVVDNDPDEGARPVVAAIDDERVRYVVEPAPGIAAARNRAFDEAADARVLVFIDDDERPTSAWLRSLLGTWRRSGATAVAGRVVPVYPPATPAWIVDGKFFVRRSLPTGSVVAAAPTSNLLLDMEAVRGLGLRFDSRFGLAGGEDTLLTRQIVRAGGSIVWCDESVVEDPVPVERARVRWVLQRAWSHGNASTRVDLALARTTDERLRVRGRAAIGGMARVCFGIARAALGVVMRSNEHSARGLRAACRGAGMAVAALGVVYEEYARSVGGA